MPSQKWRLSWAVHPPSLQFPHATSSPDGLNDQDRTKFVTRRHARCSTRRNMDNVEGLRVFRGYITKRSNYSSTTTPAKKSHTPVRLSHRYEIWACLDMPRISMVLSALSTKHGDVRSAVLRLRQIAGLDRQSLSSTRQIQL